MKLSGLTAWGILCVQALVSVSTTEAFVPSSGSTRVRQQSKPTHQLSSFVDTDESAPRNFDTLDEWALNCGVQKSGGFQWTTEPNDNTVDGREVNVGVMTNQDIPTNEPVLFVPSSVILTGQKAREELEIDEGAESLLRRWDSQQYIPHYYLMLKILAEYEKGDQSPWYSWLNSLPRYFSNGSSMTQFCCAKLLPPFAGELANQERIRFTYFYKALKDNPVVFDERIQTNDIDLARWAFAVVFTRCTPFGGGDGTDAQIIPIADYFNHGTETEVGLNIDEEGNAYVYATKDIPAGSPLRVSYGEPTNPSYLFARYGFLDESSPATFCKIMIPDPSPELVNMGCDPSKMLFYKDTGEVSQEVWDVLLYQMLDPASQQALYQAHMSGDYNTKQQFHQQYYPQTYAALQHHLSTFLGELDVLVQNADGKNMNIHPRIPLVLKHNGFVRQTFLLVQQRLQM